MQQNVGIPEFVTQFIEYCEYHQPGWLIEWEEADDRWQWHWYDTYALEHLPPKLGGMLYTTKYKSHNKKKLKRDVVLLYNRILEKQQEREKTFE